MKFAEKLIHQLVVMRQKLLPLTYKTGFYLLLVMVLLGSGGAVVTFKNSSKNSNATSTASSPAATKAEGPTTTTNQQPVEQTTPTSPSSKQPAVSTSPSRSTQTSTATSSSTATATTTQPKQADPLYLTSCIYQGAPHNGEYCPYSPPPAWLASTATYTCSNSSNLVPCPPYSSTTLIFGDVGIATGSSGANAGQQWVSQADCYFRFGDGVQRIVSMNLTDVVTTTSSNGVLSGTIDCLTANPR